MTPIGKQLKRAIERAKKWKAATVEKTRENKALKRKLTNSESKVARLQTPNYELEKQKQAYKVLMELLENVRQEAQTSIQNLKTQNKLLQKQIQNEQLIGADLLKDKARLLTHLRLLHEQRIAEKKRPDINAVSQY